MLNESTELIDTLNANTHHFRTRMTAAGFNVSVSGVPVPNTVDNNTCLKLRDWSLITGRGWLQNEEIACPKLAPPPLQYG